MDVNNLIARYPRLYHMAEDGTWPSIREIGLLSASAILDRFGYEGEKRFALESMQRPEKVIVKDAAKNGIVLRDQKPMNDDRLNMALQDGLRPREWYEIINRRVFFWAKEERLFGLLEARHYRALPHHVLTIDTESLVKAHQHNIWLCHMNSGNTFPIPHQRGANTFQSISDYPSKGNGAPVREVVELTVGYKVEDIAKHVLEIRRMQGTKVLGIIDLA